MPSLKRALLDLPVPTACYAARGVVFDVHRVKDLHKNRWQSTALKTILLSCRASYARYGNRPPLDVYDKKAAIYLVRARYHAMAGSQSQLIEEWLSIRMVPGDGSPSGLHEPEIFEYRGTRADTLIKRKVGARAFWRHIAGSQRMCGIHPYRAHSSGAVSFLHDPGHRYTAICFALMHAQFARDYPLSRFPYRYITALIRPDYYKKGLAYRSTQGKMVRPVFVSAGKFLGVREDAVRVKRDVFSYQYPLYWFDAKRLLGLVNDLRRTAKKSPLQTLEPKMFYNIIREADRPTAIAGIRIQPIKMRQLMDTLPDAPGLKVTPAATWYRGMEAVLKAAGVKAVRGQ